jgi:hypothetical protein
MGLGSPSIRWGQSFGSCADVGEDAREADLAPLDSWDDPCRGAVESRGEEDVVELGDVVSLRCQCVHRSPSSGIWSSTFVRPAFSTEGFTGSENGSSFRSPRTANQTLL